MWPETYLECPTIDQVDWDAVLLSKVKLQIEKRKAENNNISKYRTVVENVFARMKQTFRILDKKWTFRKDYYRPLYMVLCTMYNFMCQEGYQAWPRDPKYFFSNEISEMDARVKVVLSGTTEFDVMDGFDMFDADFMTDEEHVELWNEIAATMRAGRDAAE